MKRKRSEASDHKVILVVGAASLDRLLTIPKYPAPDAKIRSTDYNEVCGGNAANSASAIARLVDANCWKQDKKIVVKLLTKIGGDEVGKTVIKQLEDSNVDLSSPLFKIAENLTTSVCTILVDSAAHTRTCIFTVGSCGELTLEDVCSANFESIFENVIHLHSDSRHTKAVLALTQEAKKRGIPVSLDCEKDRQNSSFDKLLEISDMLFINSSCLDLYLKRLEEQLVLETGRVKKHENMPRITVLDGSLEEETTQIYSRSFKPCAFLHRWYHNPKRQCIVTHGSLGALHFQSVGTKEETGLRRSASDEITIKASQDGTMRLEHIYANSTSKSQQQDHYKVHQIGVLKNVNVIDTTGAGDAFMGAFLLVTYAGLGGDTVVDAMTFATWVSGKKLEGVGAQRGLPRGIDADKQLGIDRKGVSESLHSLVGSQFNSKS